MEIVPIGIELFAFALCSEHFSKPMDPNKLLEAMPEYDSGQMGHTESDRGTADGTSTGTGEEGNRKPKAPALLLPTLVERLNDVARRMIENGAAAECTSVYREVRGSTLEMTMRRLGVEMVTRDDILRMQWEDLENKIGNWIQFIKICVSKLTALFLSVGQFQALGMQPEVEILSDASGSNTCKSPACATPTHARGKGSTVPKAPAGYCDSPPCAHHRLLARAPCPLVTAGSDGGCLPRGAQALLSSVQR